MKKIGLIAALLFSTVSAGAIELSLEENRAERGAVGYVDLSRLFSSSPDAQRAKETFEELVRQAEERVNLRKAELLKLRQELDQTRAEREALAPSTFTAASSPIPAPQTAKPRPLALPGMPELEPAETTPPAVPSDVAVSTPSAAVAASTTSAAVPPDAAQKLLELDGKIAVLQADIARKEAELTREHDDSDRGLLDAEGRKTDQVLARLYRAIGEVAHQEGIGVVVDKTTLLYGHRTADLTEKVLKRLNEAPRP